MLIKFEAGARSVLLNERTRHQQSPFDLERSSHRSQFKAIDDAAAAGDHHVHDGGAEQPGGCLDYEREVTKVIITSGDIASYFELSDCFSSVSPLKTV